MTYKFLFLIFFLFSFNSYAVLNENVCASLVVTELKTTNTVTPAQEARMITQWTAICKGLITHIKTAADLNFLAGDIPVPSAGLISQLPGVPVTGAAQNAASLLVGKIQ